MTNAEGLGHWSLVIEHWRTPPLAPRDPRPSVSDPAPTTGSPPRLSLPLRVLLGTPVFLLRAALGLFVLWQIIFLFGYNLLEIASDEWRDRLVEQRRKHEDAREKGQIAEGTWAYRR